MCCSFSCAFSLLGCSSDNAASKDERDISNERFTVNSLCATDDLGRVISAKDMKEDGKYVGIWYSLWEGQHSGLQYESTIFSCCSIRAKKGRINLPTCRTPDSSIIGANLYTATITCRIRGC